MIYFAFVYSQILYGIEVYAFPTYLTKLKHPILNYTKHIQRYSYIYYIIFTFLFLCISMFITEFG